MFGVVYFAAVNSTKRGLYIESSAIYNLREVAQSVSVWALADLPYHHGNSPLSCPYSDSDEGNYVRKEMRTTGCHPGLTGSTTRSPRRSKGVGPSPTYPTHRG